MNCQAIQTVLLHSRSANAARMVLLVIAAHTDAHGRVNNLSISKIMEESNAKERTVKYAIEELRDELKELTTERDGKGRGSTFDFDISPLLERVQISASDNRADSAPLTEQQSENKGANISTGKGANLDIKGADSAPLSDVRVQISTGTPLAPYSAETTNTDKEEKTTPPKRGGVPPENSEGFVVQTYVGRLLEFRCADLGARQLATAKMEAAAAKWMHGAGYTTEQVKACYQFLKAQKWRTTDVTLVTVKGQIAAYLKGDLNDERRTANSKSDSPRTDTLRSRDYRVFAGSRR